MGYLTTITIRNDALQTIQDNADVFMEKLLCFCGSWGSLGREEYFGVGNHGNPVVLQTPRHADSCTIYVHMGNTVVEMNPYSEHTEEMLARSPDFFDRVLKFMESEVRELKALKKRVKQMKRVYLSTNSKNAFSEPELELIAEFERKKDGNK